jgi:hypothetical protein
LNEQEFDEMFQEGFLAYTNGTLFGIYKNTLDRIDPKAIKDKTEDIDYKMESKGYKPLNNPSEQQMKTCIRGKNSKKKGDRATTASVFNLTKKLKYGFVSFNGRKYMYIQSAPITSSNRKHDLNKGNIGAVYPVYINDKEQVYLGTIIITNKMLK